MTVQKSLETYWIHHVRMMAGLQDGWKKKRSVKRRMNTRVGSIVVCHIQHAFVCMCGTEWDIWYEEKIRKTRSESEHQVSWFGLSLSNHGNAESGNRVTQAFVTIIQWCADAVASNLFQHMLSFYTGFSVISHPLCPIVLYEIEIESWSCHLRSHVCRIEAEAITRDAGVRGTALIEYIYREGENERVRVRVR